MLGRSECELITLRKTLNSIKKKDDIHVDDDDDDDDFNMVIWNTKEYHDVELVCTDDVHIRCHKAILSISPLFAKFHADVSPDFYLVDYESKPLLLLLEIMYMGQVSTLLVVIYSNVNVFEKSEVKKVLYCCIFLPRQF
jgi:hypothetical protein